jgi:hypothetical protein
MADHRVYCHLCGHLGTDGPTRVRCFLVFTFCGKCHSTRREECEDLMNRATGPIPAPS